MVTRFVYLYVKDFQYARYPFYLRGFNIGKKTHSRNRSYGSESGLRSPRACIIRIPLCPTVLLEMVHLAYFSMFNGYGVRVDLDKLLVYEIFTH